MLGEIDMFIKDGIAYAGDARPALKICGVRPELIVVLRIITSC